MKRSTIVLAHLGALAVGAVGVACGSSGALLFGGAGGGGGAGPASSGKGSTGGNTGAISSSSGQSLTATSSGATSSSSGQSLTATSSSSGTGSSSSSSSSSSGALPLIHCANGICAAGQICCYAPVGPGDHCGTQGQCGAGFVELTCSVPADCPGEVCCAHGALVAQDAGGSLFIYSGISCAPTCPYTTPETEFPLCDAPVGGVMSPECGTGKTCTQSTELGSNYYTCQ